MVWQVRTSGYITALVLSLPCLRSNLFNECSSSSLEHKSYIESYQWTSVFLYLLSIIWSFYLFFSKRPVWWYTAITNHSCFQPMFFLVVACFKINFVKFWSKTYKLMKRSVKYRLRTILSPNKQQTTYMSQRHIFSQEVGLQKKTWEENIWKRNLNNVYKE